MLQNKQIKWKMIYLIIQYCIAKEVTKVGLYRTGEYPLQTELPIFPLFKSELLEICFKENSFSYCPRESEFSRCRYCLPRCRFFIFSDATDGEAPSISATLKMLRTLTCFRIAGSANTLIGCISQPPSCLRPTPQQILLSPSLGKASRSEKLRARGILLSKRDTFCEVVSSEARMMARDTLIYC